MGAIYLQAKANPKLVGKIFLTFLRISSLTLGGGYAMVTVMQWEAKKLNWTSEEEFYRDLSLAQAIPGPIAFNTAVLLGKRVAGPLGSLAAGIAVVLPPFFAIVAIASILRPFLHSVYVQAFLKGCYAAVIGLVFNVLYDLVKRQRWTVYNTLIVSVGTVLLLYKSVFLIPVFFGTIALLYVRGAER